MILGHGMLMLSHQRCVRPLNRSPYIPEVKDMSFFHYFQSVTDRVGRPRASDLSAPHGINATGAGIEDLSRHGLMVNRRKFLGALAAVSTAMLPWRRLNAAGGASQAVILCRCFIAGFQFHEGPAVLPGLAAGQQLILKREPANLYDPLAIAVHTASGSKIGYLPRRLNEIPSTLMDSGRPLTAVIAGVAPSASPWEMVEMEINLG